MMEHGLYAHQATLLRSSARDRGWIIDRTQLFAPLGAVYDVFVGWLREKNRVARSQRHAKLIS